MLDVSDINMIQVISEVGSINKAAEILCVSQPTLSKKVARLEQKINLSLFYRDNSGMHATEAAKLLLSESENLKQQLAVIERRLELMANLVGGNVKIGVGAIVEQDILPKVLLDFAEQNYHFGITVVTLSAEGLLEALKNSQIDIAVGPFSQDQLSLEITSTHKKSDKLVVVARAGHELQNKKNISLAEVMNHKVISPNVPKSLGNQVVDALSGEVIKPTIINDNYSMAKTIVSNSDFISVGPESLFHAELNSNKLCSISFDKDIVWECRCLVKPEILLVPIIKEIVELFGQYMEPDLSNHDK